MNDEFSELPAGSVALVTGATGFTGQALVRKLCEQGVIVKAIARASSDLGALEGLPIEWHRGEVYDERVIAGAMPGVQYIFHVAAAYRDPSIQDEMYTKVNYTSTLELAEAALGLPSLRRFVHVSTVGVHGHVEDPPADESYRFEPGDIYQQTKADAELWISSFARERSLPISIIRPAAIYGPGDRRLFKMFRMAKLPVFPLFGWGQGLFHMIHVEDLADILIRAALHPKALGEVFIAGNAEPSRLRDIVRTIARELGNPRIFFARFPALPLFLAADVCEKICRPLGIDPPLYRRRVAFFTKDRSFDTSKLRDVLGYRQSFSPEEGLRSTARWYREHGWL